MMLFKVPMGKGIEDGRLRMEDGRVKGVASRGWKHRTPLARERASNAQLRLASRAGIEFQKRKAA
jgi:hypothetical protein